MKTIKHITVVFDSTPPHGKSIKELAEENRKLRSENEVLKMQLAGRDHYANKADEFLRKLAGELKDNGFC